MIGLVSPRTAGVIMELGSGWGGLAIAAARAYPGCRVVGVEYSPFPYLAARLRRFFLPSLANLSFVRQNFFETSFSETEVILCYLSNPIMARLRGKFLKELPKGATIISSTFFIPDWEPEKVIDLGGLWKTRLFVYRKA